MSAPSVKLAMTFQGMPLLAKGLRQLFHQIYRAVLPTRTADGHRHIAAVIPDQSLQPVADELLDVIEHIVHFGMHAQKAGDSFVLSI